MTGELKQGVQRSDWIHQGLCSIESDPFTRSNLDVDACKSICKRCPVLDLCLGYAIANDERYGVWGATTPKERKALRPQLDVSQVPLEFRDHYLQMEGRVKRSAPTLHYMRNPNLDIVIDPDFLSMLDSFLSPYPDPTHQ